MRSSGIISVENSEKDLERAADTSGTDAFMVRHATGILVPLASRVEFFNQNYNNPDNPRYVEHYPRFTVRLQRRLQNGTYSEDVECKKRIAALDDPISRRYLPLYTIQSIVKKSESGIKVMQTSCVKTEDLFEYIKSRRLDDPKVGTVSYTNIERDGYRLITVEKLNKSGIPVRVQILSNDLA
jgi:hypothetical protein